MLEILSLAAIVFLAALLAVCLLARAINWFEDWLIARK